MTKGAYRHQENESTQCQYRALQGGLAGFISGSETKGAQDLWFEVKWFMITAVTGEKKHCCLSSVFQWLWLSS